MSHDITVHHFHADPGPSSQDVILDAGHRLVDAATASDRWCSVDAGSALSAFSSFDPKGACFVWARAPPVIPRNAYSSHREPVLEDWDAPFEVEEKILDVSALPEFEPSDFSQVVRPSSRGKRKSHPSSPGPTRHFADDVDINLDTRAHKRRRSQSSPHISISTLIPFVSPDFQKLFNRHVTFQLKCKAFRLFQPHYLESPDPACPPPPEIERIPAFCIARSFSLRALTEPFARTAWLVPLRGHPPLFDGTSPARVCSHTPALAPLLPETHIPPCINWTPIGITYFWTFLLRQRHMNNFGPIALSYACSPAVPDSSLCSDEGKGTAKPKGKGKGKERARQEDVWEGAQEWEYVKIYHDARWAMRLRSLLDSFRWEEALEGCNAPRRVRVLKEARLVLVDETGEAVLLA